MVDSPDDEIRHHELDTDDKEPVLQVAEIVAELEGKEQDELRPTYEHLDHLLQHIFEQPPVPEAQVEITFTYEDYRITVEQNGTARFVKVGDQNTKDGDST